MTNELTLLHLESGPVHVGANVVAEWTGKKWIAFDAASGDRLVAKRAEFPITFDRIVAMERYGVASNRTVTTAAKRAVSILLNPSRESRNFGKRHDADVRAIREAVADKRRALAEKPKPFLKCDDAEKNARIDKARRAIDHHCDGPVTLFVALARATEAAAQGHDDEAVANALFDVLTEYGWFALGAAEQSFSLYGS